MTIWQCLISSRIFSASQRTTTSMQPHRQRQGLRSSPWRESHWPDSCGIRKLGANRVLPLCGFGQPARKDVVNDQLGWRLPRTGGLQFTKRDTPQCRWGVIHETGRHSTGCACRPGPRSPVVFGAREPPGFAANWVKYWKHTVSDIATLNRKSLTVARKKPNFQTIPKGEPM